MTNIWFKFTNNPNGKTKPREFSRISLLKGRNKPELQKRVSNYKPKKANSNRYNGNGTSAKNKKAIRKPGAIYLAQACVEAHPDASNFPQAILDYCADRLEFKNRFLSLLHPKTNRGDENNGAAIIEKGTDAYIQSLFEKASSAIQQAKEESNSSWDPEQVTSLALNILLNNEIQSASDSIIQLDGWFDASKIALNRPAHVYANVFKKEFEDLEDVINTSFSTRRLNPTDDMWSDIVDRIHLNHMDGIILDLEKRYVPIGCIDIPKHVEDVYDQDGRPQRIIYLPEDAFNLAEKIDLHIASIRNKGKYKEDIQVIQEEKEWLLAKAYANKINIWHDSIVELGSDSKGRIPNLAKQFRVVRAQRGNAERLAQKANTQETDTKIEVQPFTKEFYTALANLIVGHNLDQNKEGNILQNDTISDFDEAVRIFRYCRNQALGFYYAKLEDLQTKRLNGDLSIGVELDINETHRMIKKLGELEIELESNARKKQKALYEMAEECAKKGELQTRTTKSGAILCRPEAFALLRDADKFRNACRLLRIRDQALMSEKAARKKKKKIKDLAVQYMAKGRIEEKKAIIMDYLKKIENKTKSFDPDSKENNPILYKPMEKYREDYDSLVNLTKEVETCYSELVNLAKEACKSKREIRGIMVRPGKAISRREYKKIKSGYDQLKQKYGFYLSATKSSLSQISYHIDDLIDKFLGQEDIEKARKMTNYMVGFYCRFQDVLGIKIPEVTAARVEIDNMIKGLEAKNMLK